MNPIATAATSGENTPHDLFALTDEQILAIEPESAGVARSLDDVPVRAGQPAAQPVPRSGESGEQHGPDAGSAQGAPPSDPSSTAAGNAPSQPTAPFAKPEDVRALAELYPGGLNQAKTAAERARTLDEIDAAYFGAGGNSPEQISAARTQLAQRMLREDPAAFREMVFEGLRALQGASVAQPISAAPPANSTVPPAAAAPSTPAAPAELSAPPQHLAAYTSFEKAANEELERSVGGAIDRALHQALPNLGRGEESANAGARHAAPLQARLGAAIRDEVEKALQGDRQLGEQVAQILSARRFDNETRAQVVRLIGERAQQLVPGAAKRALNDWTQATLAAHRATTRHADTNASRVDLSPATGQGSPGQVASTHSATSARSENARAASARATHAPKSSRVDYRKLSDDQILDL